MLEDNTATWLCDVWWDEDNEDSSGITIDGKPCILTGIVPTYDISFLRGYNQQRFTTDDQCPDDTKDRELWQKGFDYGMSITQLEDVCDAKWPRVVE